MSVGVPFSRARSTASSTWERTSSTSIPSTASDGMAYAHAFWAMS